MRTERDCTHCGLPIPDVESGASPFDAKRFCCAGCEAVYHAIHDQGLEHFYDLRNDGTPAAARPTGRSYAELDDPTFTELYCRDLGGELQETELYLEGLHCSACIWLIEKLPQLVDGLMETRVDFGRSRCLLRWDPTGVQLSEIARRLDSLGYASHPYRGGERRRAVRREDRAFLVRLGLSGACAGNVMLISFALYGGAFHGMEPRFESLFRWASLILSLPVLLVGGTVFFRGAWSGLRMRAVHMDLPISLGILAGFTASAVNTIRGAGEIYFDSVTALVFLLLAGRLLQRRQQRRAADATELLYSVTPRHARKVVAGVVNDVPVEALVSGDQVRLLPGDVVPADGAVVEGRSSIDASLLTGEANPVAVRSGAELHAGTVNVTSPIDMEVTAAGEATRIGQLMKMVEDLSSRRAPIVQLADRIAGRFVAAVVLLAGATAALWSWIDPSEVLGATTALLVVTCPCALGLATPLAVSAAIGKAAALGMLIKGGHVFESLARPGIIWLDKTGTVTTGELELAEWHGPKEAKPWVAALEAQSSHPIARALCRSLGTRDELPVTNVEEIAGRGIEGVVSGRVVRVGSPEDLDASGDRVARRLAESGATPIAISVDGEVVAHAGLRDRLRPDSRATVARLSAAGWSVGLLSGDHPDVVSRTGRLLGIPPHLCIGGVSPEEKLEMLRRCKTSDTVVMVGDGINDSVALAAADVGVAVEGGAEAALSAADVYLSRGGVSQVWDLTSGSRRTLKTIRRGLAFSLLYNCFAASLAIAGVMHPVIAAVLMPVSSLTVITYAYRSRTFADVESGKRVSDRTAEGADSSIPEIMEVAAWR